eukprot:TRINITY_DN16789_c0_g3_i1.p1 TRINITY_DN16789_c0_g3~~TRINITY_DN16789_c0_g3_i1.p1  ORF type:complete len:288 (+),score=94.75 TRINITY_DN16789_c0_g3_i1:161-1024(+)
MKGARAKREAAAAAEAAAKAAAEENGGMKPTPPSEPRDGPPRPGGPIVAADDTVIIPAEVFRKICAQIRTNELLGSAAADALEAAAGQRPVASPQSKAAKELRSNVAESREDEPKEEAPKKKKKAMNFAAEEPEEIPDLPPPADDEGKRTSISEPPGGLHDVEEMESHPNKDATEPPELNLNPKQNSLRTNLEMWVMDEIPGLFGVDDSEELAEPLQEDGQALHIALLIAEEDASAQPAMVEKWLANGELKDADAKEEFVTQLVEKVGKIQALGTKKKKKKKKTEDA